MVRRFPEIAVTGIDIARHSIQLNQRLQRERGMQNLEFLAYDGRQMPFASAWFGGVVCRYAFHHFPDTALSVQELYRITEAEGFVIATIPFRPQSRL